MIFSPLLCTHFYSKVKFYNDFNELYCVLSNFELGDYIQTNLNTWCVCLHESLIFPQPVGIPYFQSMYIRIIMPTSLDYFETIH